MTSIPSADAKEKKVNEILTVFIELLFAHLIFEAGGKMENITSTVFKGEVQEVFNSAMKLAEQARM